MSRFARIVLCTAVLTFWTMALPLISAGQNLKITTDSQGRTLATVSPIPSNPSAQAVKSNASIPEGTTVIFSNFGSGDSYNCCIAWPEFGLDNGLYPGEILAMPFTPTQSVYQLTQIDIAMSYAYTGTNGTTLELCEDDGGQPGRIISFWEVTGLPYFGSTSNQVQTIKVSQVILLAPYHQYWLVPIVNANELAVWNINTVSSSGIMAVSSNNGETWSVGPTTVGQGAFDVLGLPF